jgi:hypothetical protein
MADMEPKTRQEPWDEVAADLAPLVMDEVRQVVHDLGAGRLSTDAVVVARRPGS